jgi:GxxExxY protein
MKHGLNTDDFEQAEKPILLFEHLTKEIIGSAFEVYNVLGWGFLEKVYQRAMQAELLRRQIKAETEHKITVLYKGAIIGDYAADLFVADQIIVELKVSPVYNPDDEPQLLNELKASGKVGLLINFGRRKVEFKRLVF